MSVVFEDMNSLHFVELLRAQEACSEGVDWVEREGLTFREAWESCRDVKWKVWAVVFLQGAETIEDKYYLWRDLDAHCGCLTRMSECAPKSDPQIEAGLATFVTWEKSDE